MMWKIARIAILRAVNAEWTGIYFSTFYLENWKIKNNFIRVSQNKWQRTPEGWYLSYIFEGGFRKKKEHWNDSIIGTHNKERKE